MKTSQNNAVPTGTLVWRISLRLFLVGMIVLFCLTLLRPLLHLFMPFVIAYLVTALILAPVLRRVGERLKRRKFLSMLLVVLLLLLTVGLLAAILYYLISQAAELVRNWESMQDSLENAKGALADFVAKYTDWTPEMIRVKLDLWTNNAIDWIKNSFFEIDDIRSYLNTVKNTAPAVGNFLLGFVFFVIAAYFTAAEYPAIRRKLSGAVPDFFRPQLRCIRQAAGGATFGYLRAQVILASVVALITFVALLIYGQSFALVIALAVGIVDFFPFFGSSVILVPWAIVAFLQGDWVCTVFLLALTFVLFLFRKLAEPKIVGDQTGLHPLLSLMSMYVGMKLAGILGMILMPILWMAAISLYRVGFFDPTIQDFRLLAARIGERARLTPTDKPEN